MKRTRKKNYRAIISLIRTILESKKSGIGAFYNGLIVDLTATFINSFIYFYVYSSIKKLVTNYHHQSRNRSSVSVDMVFRMKGESPKVYKRKQDMLQTTASSSSRALVDQIQSRSRTPLQKPFQNTQSNKSQEIHNDSQADDNEEEVTSNKRKRRTKTLGDSHLRSVQDQEPQQQLNNCHQQIWSRTQDYLPKSQSCEQSSGGAGSVGGSGLLLRLFQSDFFNVHLAIST
ncbi:hypothetical protein PPACK8108_LOCUS25475 [Phakopsora pachyrhizi]|uniref:Uncharacterized protein n=1 Tax=Phakopsora pachyrhizi TaxID=170000 RepID=A0AAV0BRY7_PHAPC|nr:hypothetical protein PPACK8108_LOCUS25475 [Phakopsora pachyrhizi]